MINAFLILLEADFSFIGFLVIALIIFATFFFRRRLVVLRGLQDKELKKISQFKDNDQGKIIGKVIYGGEVIFAPISKRKCVYYRIIVEQYGSSGKTGWFKIIDEERSGDIVMYDGSGYAIIDANGSKNYLVEDEIRFFDSDTQTSTLEDFLTKHNVESKGFLDFHKTFRYKEGVLEKGEVFTVSGEGQWNKSKDYKLNIPSEKVLVIIPGKAQHVYITDDPKAIEPE